MRYGILSGYLWYKKIYLSGNDYYAYFVRSGGKRFWTRRGAEKMLRKLESSEHIRNTQKLEVVNIRLFYRKLRSEPW